jgi:hypothetical protein
MRKNITPHFVQWIKHPTQRITYATLVGWLDQKCRHEVRAKTFRAIQEHLYQHHADDDMIKNRAWRQAYRAYEHALHEGVSISVSTGRPPLAQKRVRTSITLPPEVHDRICEWAERIGSSKSTAIEIALLEFLGARNA